MIEETTLTIFLTSGITIKVKENEKITVMGRDYTLDLLYKKIGEIITKQLNLEFTQEIKHKYDEDKEQDVKHSYFIPYDKIAWYLKEEV